MRAVSSPGHNAIVGRTKSTGEAIYGGQSALAIMHQQNAQRMVRVTCCRFLSLHRWSPITCHQNTMPFSNTHATQHVFKTVDEVHLAIQHERGAIIQCSHDAREAEASVSNSLGAERHIDIVMRLAQSQPLQI